MEEGYLQVTTELAVHMHRHDVFLIFLDFISFHFLYAKESIPTHTKEQSDST